MIGVGLVIVLGLWLAFERTRIGAQIRATVDNRRMAESLGINVDRLFTITFAFGSGMAALGGGLGAEFLGLDPQYALKYLVYFLIVVSVGGLGSVVGVFYASLLLGVLDFVLKLYLPKGGTIFIYALTILLLLWRPRDCSEGRDVSVAAAPAGPAAGAGRSTIRRRASSSGGIACAGGRRCPGSLALGVYFIFPDYLSFGAELLITILFALSLDLALGYAGIITLGHAAFFGAGAYTVGLLAFHGLWSEPITSLMLAAAAAADRPRLGPRPAAHHRPHPAHAHDLHHGALGRGRQHGARLHRRLRRVDEPSHYPGFGISSSIRSTPTRNISTRWPCSSSASRSCAPWSIRRSARASPASAKMRCACMRSARRCGAGS